MSVITAAAPVTPEDLLQMPDAVNYELIDGKLVERHMGLESSKIALRIAFLLGQMLHDRRLGHLFGADASFQCFPDSPDRVRRPDVSFIRFGRFDQERLPKGHCPIAPDLVVEVVSPGDLAYEIEEKVAEYLRAGVSLVWVVYPPTRIVEIHRPASSTRGNVWRLSGSDTVSGEDVLPGFSCAVAEFFA